MYGLGAGLSLLALASQAAAIATIEPKGSKLFQNGQQWFIKGVAYQLTNDDPLADGDQCAKDVALMKTLGTNAIRVYHVDASANHDACMQTLSDAGIYAFIDLDTFDTYIIDTPQGTPQWNQSQYEAYAKVMDAFQGYDNVAGFFVGNEVLNEASESPAAPYVKAAARDMKAYRDKQGYRSSLMIGYSAADIASLRPNLQNYLACGDDTSAMLDFFSLNAYEWCGDSSYDTSGYSALNANASDYPIPIFFSETGCNTVQPRTFGDQAAILGPDMDQTWSGAIIYEWIEETNNYGLISYGPPAAATATGANVIAGYTRQGTPTPVQPDFDNLSSQWATLSPSGVAMSAYSPTASALSCPAYTSGAWEVSGNAPLPTLGQVYTGAATTPSTTSAGTGSSQGTGSMTGSGSQATKTGTAASGSGSGSGSGSSAGTAALSSATTGAGMRLRPGGFVAHFLL